MNPYSALLLLSVAVASLSQILLKKSTTKTYQGLLQEYVNPYVITGYLLMIISTILTILAFRGLSYKEGPLLESTGYLLVMGLSSLFLKEKITKRKIIGNIIIILGILVFYI